MFIILQMVARTCSATNPPSWWLSFTYLSTEVFRKASNSSIDSGSGSATGSGSAAAGVVALESEAAGGGGGAAKEGFGGEGIAWLRTVASAGGSVEEAISSRREVAASSLDGVYQRLHILE